MDKNTMSRKNVKDNYSELLKINTFFVEKSIFEKGSCAILFNFVVDWEIDGYAIPSFEEETKKIFLDVPHNGVVSRLEFGYTNKSKVVNIAFDYIIKLIKKNELSFIAQDGYTKFVILSRFK